MSRVAAARGAAPDSLAGVVTMSGAASIFRSLGTLPPALVAFVLAMGARAWLIDLFPLNYSFDAYQRWGGREHVLVQGWLPVTQSLVWLVQELGGGLMAVFWVMSFVAALAHAAGTRVAEWLGGRSAAWAFVALGGMGPFLCWSRVPYQEGVFLALLLGGLAQAAAGRWLLADLLVGAIGLVRYEGWAFVALYLAWRRSPRAFAALWGAVAWGVIYGALGMRGYAASPVDFDDWEGLGERFTLSGWFADLGGFGEQAWDAGTVPLAIAGVWGAVVLWRRRQRDVALILALVAAQLGITAVWIAGLEISTYRMQVVPGVLLGLLGAAAAADLWDNFGDARVRRLVETMLVLFWCGQVDEGAREARMSLSLVLEEREAMKEIRQHPDVVWWVEPRDGMGTRDRHDGCEALQGMLEDFRHGREFWCAKWLEPDQQEAARAMTRGVVRWEADGYRVWPDGPPPEGSEEDAVATPRRARRTPAASGYEEPIEAAPQ